MNTAPFFCFPWSWSRLKRPLPLGKIFLHFFRSGEIKISRKICNIIQQSVHFKAKASVQVAEKNPVVFCNLLRVFSGLGMKFFQNAVPILFKKVNFCFFLRRFWHFQRRTNGFGRKSLRKGNWNWLWQNFHLKFLLVTFSAEFVSSTFQSRGNCFGINFQLFCCCCNAGKNLVENLGSDMNRSGVFILGFWIFFPGSRHWRLVKNRKQEKVASIC